MKEVPPLPGEEALYAWIRSVWEAAAKDPATKQALVASFVSAQNELVNPWFNFKYNGRPIGNGWTAPANASRWGTDYLNRTAISKSSMYQNTPEETQYQFREYDSQGQPLDGHNQYTVTFPKGKLPPVKGFWSLTLYNAEKFFHANELNHFSLGTKNKDLAIRRGRFAHTLCGREVAGQRQGVQLASRTERAVIAVVAKLLAGAGGHRRHIRAAGGSEGELIREPLMTGDIVYDYRDHDHERNDSNAG